MSWNWPAVVQIALTGTILAVLLHASAGLREYGYARCAGMDARDRGERQRGALQRWLWLVGVASAGTALLLTRDPHQLSTWLALLWFGCLFELLALAAVLDEATLRVPDALSLPLIAACLLSAATRAGNWVPDPQDSLMGAGLGMALGSTAPLLGSWLIERRDERSVGEADTLLFCALGAALGAMSLLLAVATASLVSLALRRWLRRGDGALPFVPGLYAGAVVVIVLRLVEIV